MTITYFDAANNPRRILSEHKIAADLTDYQKLAYLDWQPDALVLVAPSADIATYSGLASFDKCISWLDIALAIDSIGTKHAGSDWRTTAVDPDAPSRLRMLLEVLAFIQRQGVGVSSLLPMDGREIEIYGSLRDTRETMRNFLEIVRVHPSVQALDPSPIAQQRGDTQWWFSLETTWPYLVDRHPVHWAEIALQPEDEWLDDQLHEPLLYAGFAFDAPSGLIPAEMVARDAPVAVALQEADAHVGLHPNGQVKCAATLYLKDALAMGGTLEEQAAQAAIWAATAIQKISQVASSSGEAQGT